MYYVQTEEEMKQQLLDQGLGEGVFLPGDGRELSGEEMQKLCLTLAGLEDALVALERRGISLRDHADRRDSSEKASDVSRLFGAEEHWFTSRDQLEAFVESKEKITGGELEAGKADENKPGGGAPIRNPPNINSLL